MEWRTSESSAIERPKELDTTSSRIEIYIRKDFTRVTRENENGTNVLLWQYKETTIPQGKYDDGILCLIADLLKSANSQDTIMMALADIYEKLEETK